MLQKWLLWCGSVLCFPFITFENFEKFQAEEEVLKSFGYMKVRIPQCKDVYAYLLVFISKNHA